MSESRAEVPDLDALKLGDRVRYTGVTFVSGPHGRSMRAGVVGTVVEDVRYYDDPAWVVEWECPDGKLRRLIVHDGWWEPVLTVPYSEAGDDRG